MPRFRPPKEIWQYLRKQVYQWDKGRCQGPYCKNKPKFSLTFENCHVDHIQSGKFGTNQLSNLRLLCRKCHVLRADFRHRGMIAKALKDDIIPPNWRELVWDD